MAKVRRDCARRACTFRMAHCGVPIKPDDSSALGAGLSSVIVVNAGLAWTTTPQVQADAVHITRLQAVAELLAGPLARM
jgi:hypothetical protein